MKIHEYQAKELLKKFNVPVPQGNVATTSGEARQVAEELAEGPFVVKAQIHAGGRGKGGGIKTAATPEEVERLADQILGMTLVTPQTGPEGKVVNKVLVEQAQDIAQELYLGMVVDRASGRPVIMMSAEGGMEIEEVAARTPERIFKEAIDPAAGFFPTRPGTWPSGSGWLPPCSARPQVSSRTSTACSSPWTAPWRRSTPWWSPRTAPCWPWTPSSILTTTPCSATTTWRPWKTPTKWTPWSSRPGSTT